MIQSYVTDLALQDGFPTVDVSVLEGARIGCLDVYLITIISKGQKVSSLVYQSDFNCLRDGEDCERLEVRIKSALQRLKLLLDL